MKALRWPVIFSIAFMVWSCGESEQFAPMQPSSTSTEVALQKPSSNIIPGKYIIVFKDDVSDVTGLVSQISKAHGAAVEHVYRHALKGFSANLPDAAVQRLQNDPRIKYIVPSIWIIPT